MQLDGKMLVNNRWCVIADAPEGGFFKRLSDGVMLWFRARGTAKTTRANPE